MWIGRRLGLVVVGVLATLIPTAGQAAPLTEPTFVTFFSHSGSGGGWRRSTGYLQTFVHWSSDAPAWTQENIAWVRAWSGGDRWNAPEPWSQHGWYEDTPPWVSGVVFAGGGGDGDYDYGNGGVTFVAVPEPGSLMLVGAFVGSLALRRRTRS